MTELVLAETELGSFTIAVETEKAPITAANFLAYVDAGHLDRATAYRIVTLVNQPDTTKHKIEVVQWGMRASDDAAPAFPAIAHETTEATGLRHANMTISMARLDPGTAASEFFICIGDQPALDFGGQRNPDGQGFAAFGTVIEGEDTVRAIFARAGAGEYLDHPVRFIRCRRA